MQKKLERFFIGPRRARPPGPLSSSSFFLYIRRETGTIKSRSFCRFFCLFGLPLVHTAFSENIGHPSAVLALADPKT